MATAKGNRLELLRSVPLFAALSARELKVVDGLLKEDWFNAGDTIVEADDPGGRFYVLTEGRAKVTVHDKPVRTIGPGGFFGEMSLIDNGPRSATVRADTQVKALWMSRLSFLGMLEENWSTTKKILADLCARIRVNDQSSTH